MHKSTRNDAPLFDVDRYTIEIMALDRYFYPSRSPLVQKGAEFRMARDGAFSNAFISNIS
jgi:hypothetical protein